MSACGGHPSGLAPGHRAGFTLVEVLIAMLIAAIMCGIVIYLFGQVQRGARVSLARAQLSLTAATVDSRLRLDAASLLGPNRDLAQAGGCLVIVPGIREGYVPLPNGQMSANRVRLRSDQLVFMSKRDPTHPHPWVSLLPQNQNGLPPATAPTASSSWEARIWYGAVRDGNTTDPADPDQSVANLGLHAHLWMVGRQAKLLTGGAAVPNCTVTAASDTTAGSLASLKAAALAGPWTDADHVANLAVMPANQANYTNLPLATPVIDLKALQGGNAPVTDPNGIQLSDVRDSHLRLFENCSEFVVQWAGDLDKDGKIDTYPARHPLAGAIVWYPEELHDKGAWYAANAAPRLDGWNTSPKTGIGAKYAAITTHSPEQDWKGAFPSGFSTSASRFGNDYPHAFGAKGFEFEYGDQDHATTPAPAGTPAVPRPYVFRFDDDQYRLVRYGFRQDGSVYANAYDGAPLPNPAGAGNPPVVGKHHFPYPPVATAPTNWNQADPSAASLYVGKAAPGGPYPRAATPAAPAGRNFGDLMGAQMLPADAMVGANVGVTGPNGEKYRTGGNGIANDPMQYGMWVKATYTPNLSPPWYAWPVPAPTLALTTPGGGSAPVAPAIYSAQQIAALQAAPVWPYYAGGNLVAIRQADGATIGTGVAKPAGDPTADTTPFPCAANQVGPMAQVYDSTNNYAKTYTDIFAEYLKTINNPAQAADSPTRTDFRSDWRMPQSDWPRLIRIRARLHDTQGLVTSYSDEFLVNGRDNDGDGTVNNAEEGRMSGMWFEYIVAVPYPTDPNPRGH